MLYFVALMLIVGCSILNHMGGQALWPKNAGLTYRDFGVGALVALAAALLQFDLHLVLKIWAAVTAGQAIWETFKWGPGFMAVTKNSGIDARVYTDPWYKPSTWFIHLADRTLGYNRYSTLSAAQKRTWGMVFFTYRGTLHFPAFIMLGIILNPLALFGGVCGLFMGIIYRLSYNVLRAEYKYGAVYGAAYAAVLIGYKLFN